MNAFIYLRKSFFRKTVSVSFPEFYLENCDCNPAFDDGAKDSLLSKIATIRTLYRSERITVDAIIAQLSELGSNDYTDRYIVDFIIKRNDVYSDVYLQNKLRSMLTDKETAPNTLCHLLDICIECDLRLLERTWLLNALYQHETNLDVLSMVLDYMNHFHIEDCHESLYKLFNHNYPQNIKLQILEILNSSTPKKDNHENLISQIIQNVRNPQFYVDYLNLLNTETRFNPKGFTVVQTMFYGDPEFGGKGQSGGLGTFLKTLGNHLSKEPEISCIITLTINNDWSNNQTLVNHYSDKHLLIRLPAYLNTEDKHAFLFRQLFIKRFVSKFIALMNVKPDLFHIRYLDNASRAMAMLSHKIGAKLVLTLTPDPHRTMVDEQGHLKLFTQVEIMDRLNKISIGDELLVMAHGVVGIGGMAVKKELKQYFPQLRNDTGRFLFKMVGEGVHIKTAPLDFDIWNVLTDVSLPYHIHRELRLKPIILNVGRLNRQKGQDKLLKAWGESRLWKDYNLVIIGGNVENPNEEETQMLQSFTNYMESRPELQGRFAHLEALPNEMIRNIERKIMEDIPENFFHIYLCTSQKEEFGISILEAMVEKWLIFGPAQGGVKTYIKHGSNGFLIDTTSWKSISQNVETVLYDSNLNRKNFEKIQYRGQQTVLEDFSMDKIAKHFLSFYLELRQEE